jgi:hypothetical protein
MLVVTVEVWPGGRMLARRVIGTMNLANISGLADTSDYEGYIDGEPIEITGHLRSTGAWELIRTALNQHLDDGGSPGS